MSKKKIAFLIGMGVVCALALAAACGYSVLYNDARWVAPMDLSRYEFRPGDLPMLAAGALLLGYILYLVVTVLRAVWAARRAEKTADRHYTRPIRPWMGLFGLTGFLGFLGFWTYASYRVIFPFLFFVLFGLFGLYFEGKLAHTMMDEMYLEHRRMADLKAYRIGFILLFLSLWLGGGRLFADHVELCAVFMLAAVSLIYALVLVLCPYLLYRYETKD